MSKDDLRAKLAAAINRVPPRVLNGTLTVVTKWKAAAQKAHKIANGGRATEDEMLSLLRELR